MYSAARARNMTSGSILGHLTAFSLPLMIENLFQLLYNTADTIIVGRCIDKSALAAVGATSMVIWLVTAVFMGFSTGVTTMAARCYGAREYDEFRRIARNAFGAIPLVGIALMIPSMLLVPQVLDVINTPADIYVGRSSICVPIFLPCQRSQYSISAAAFCVQWEIPSGRSPS